MIKEIANISARLVRKDKETNDDIIQGSATIVADNENYYLITAYHCVEIWENDKCCIPADLSLMNAVLVLPEKSINLIIDTKRDWNGNKEEDWAIIPIFKPCVDFDYKRAVKISMSYPSTATFHSFAFPESVPEGVHITFELKNNNGLLVLKENLVDGHSKINVALKGASGAGVFLFQDGVFYLVGHLERTTPQANLNCVKMVSSSKYDSFSSDLIISAPMINPSKTGNSLFSNEIQTLLRNLVAIETSNIENSKTLIRYILKGVVESEIEHLRIKDASRILHSVKELCKDIIDSDKELTSFINQLEIECKEGEIAFADQIPVDYDELQNLVPELHNLTRSNLNDWLRLLSSMRASLGDYITLTYTQEYADRCLPAIELYEKFISLVDKTDIADRFDVIRAFYYYWCFQRQPDPKILQKFQQLNKETQEEIKMLEVLMECSMLFMCDKTEDALNLLKNTDNTGNIAVANFAVLLGYHSKRNDSIIWALNYCKEKHLSLNTTSCKAIAISLTHENADDVFHLLNELNFERAVEQKILLQRCKYVKNEPFDIQPFFSQLNTASDIMLAYAAQMLAKQGKRKEAYDLLRPRIDTESLDLKHVFLIDIMTGDKEMYTDLYHLLCNSLKKENVLDKGMLMITYQMAHYLSDTQIASQAILKLYNQTPDDEWIFVNFILTLGKTAPQELADYEQKALNYHFKDAESVRIIYFTFVENDYVQTALDVLYNNLKRLDSDKLENLYLDQCLLGKIKPLVDSELDTAIEGSYILYELSNGSRRCRKIKALTPFGDSVIGKHKGDIFESGNGEYLTIESIHNKYFYRSFNILRDMVDNGGDKTHKVFHFDVTHPENILQQFEDAIKSFGGDCIDEERLKQEYKNGRYLLLSMTKKNDLIGDMYKYLFTDFNVLTLPWKHYEIYKHEVIANCRELTLDLPALILLFEFENMTGYHYSHRFIISTHLEQLLNSYRKNYSQIMSLNFILGIQSNNLKRFSGDINKDMELRLEALLLWVKDNCDSRPATESLQLTNPDQSPVSMLFSHTMVAFLHENVILISDECNLEPIMQTPLPIISTECYMYQYEGEKMGEAFTSFLKKCNFIGALTSPEDILQQYIEKENGKNNCVELILLTIGRTPCLFLIAVKACELILEYAHNKLMAEQTISDILTLAVSSLERLTDHGEKIKEETKNYLTKTNQTSLLYMYNKCFSRL